MYASQSLVAERLLSMTMIPRLAHGDKCCSPSACQPHPSNKELKAWTRQWCGTSFFHGRAKGRLSAQEGLTKKTRDSCKNLDSGLPSNWGEDDGETFVGCVSGDRGDGGQATGEVRCATFVVMRKGVRGEEGTLAAVVSDFLNFLVRVGAESKYEFPFRLRSRSRSFSSYIEIVAFLLSKHLALGDVGRCQMVLVSSSMSLCFASLPTAFLAILRSSWRLTPSLQDRSAGR